MIPATFVPLCSCAGPSRRHGDGGCLYLQVNGPDHGAWVFMNKRPAGNGLLVLRPAVSLKDARDLATLAEQCTLAATHKRCWPRPRAN